MAYLYYIIKVVKGVRSEKDVFKVFINNWDKM